MKRFILATIATVGLASAGFAETAPKADHNPNMPAVVTDQTPAATEPAAGSNSFTQKQASALLAKQGYTKISTLKSDSNGVWRGTAHLKNTTQKVAVDYQGNVTVE